MTGIYLNPNKMVQKVFKQLAFAAVAAVVFECVFVFKSSHKFTIATLNENDNLLVELSCVVVFFSW